MHSERTGLRSPKARVTAVLTLGLILMMPAPSSAQDTGRAGLTMGYPASVGFIWHVSDRIAVRPEFSFSKSTSESSFAGIIFTELPISIDTEREVDSWSVGVGVSGIFALRRWEDLTTYVSPRFTYARTSFGSTSSGFAEESDVTGSAWSIAGSFGAQYSLGRRFGVFGEVGLGFTKSETSSMFSEGTTHTWSTRTGAGVIFYF